MATWHAKPQYGYLRSSTEAKENAEMFYGVMSSLGWCLEAVSAALGNQAGESEYNPWRWQGDEVLPAGDPRIGTIGGGNTTHAYGLFQQDPAAKYIYRAYAQSLSTYAPNYSDLAGQPHDGDAQCRYLHWICSDPNGGEWIPDAPLAQGLGMPYADFIANTRNYSVVQLTRTFFGCYERGTWSVARPNAAQYWFNYLSGIPPIPPEDNNSAWIAVFHMLAKKKKERFVYERGLYK